MFCCAFVCPNHSRCQPFRLGPTAAAASYSSSSRNTVMSPGTSIFKKSKVDIIVFKIPPKPVCGNRKYTRNICIPGTYVCQFFALFPTFFFVQALFVKAPSNQTREARPDTFVEVSARSVHSGARGGRSILFSRREWTRRSPWFRSERHYFVRTYR